MGRSRQWQFAQTDQHRQAPAKSVVKDTGQSLKSVGALIFWSSCGNGTATVNYNTMAQQAKNMNDFNELTERYVAMWNETNAERRSQMVRELWIEDGIECTAARETRGHDALEARVAASHEKNVRDAGNLFRSRRNASGHHGLVKFDWEMLRQSDGAIQATGCYVLLLNDVGKIRQAWLFVDP